MTNPTENPQPTTAQTSETLQPVITPTTYGNPPPTTEEKARSLAIQEKAGMDTGADTFSARVQSAADKAADGAQKTEGSEGTKEEKK